MNFADILKFSGHKRTIGMSTQTLSKQTQKSWWTDAGLFISAAVAALSGVYFLFLPNSGYQGGRNTYYGIKVIFSRNTWDDLHTWGGVAMIVIVVIHLVLHWRWVTSMVRRTWNELLGRCGCMNSRGRMNLILNSVVAASFALTALSGVYFLFVQGGHSVSDPMILFNQTTWDLIHTWAGVTLIVTVILHIAIHWRWIVNVTTKMVKIVGAKRSVPQSVTLSNQ
jgi:hypothetical protein